MKVKGLQSLSMIKHHTIAFEIQRTREQHRPGIENRNWSARWNGIIEPLMHALNLAIEHSPGSKNVGDRRIHRSSEIAGPLPFCVRVAKGLRLDRFILMDALQLLRAWFGISLGNGYRDAGILSPPNSNVLNKRDIGASRCGPLQFQAIATGTRFQTNTGYPIPALAGRIVAKENFVLQPLC